MRKITHTILMIFGWVATACFGIPAGIVILATAFEMKSWQQLYRLATFDYMSFVDSLDAGGAANDFFVALAALLVSCTIWVVMTWKSPARTPRTVMALVFAVFAACLVYGVEHTRVGHVPWD